VALTAFITTILQDVFSPDGTALFYFLSAFGVTLLTLLGRIVLKRQPPQYDAIAMSSVEQFNHHTEPRKQSVLDIVRRSKGNVFVVIFIYIITLSLFPSVTSQIKPTGQMDSDVFTSIHFLIFNVGDWVGRTLPISPLFQLFRVNMLVSLAIARVVFVPIFLFPIANDWVFFFMVFVFAASNGWLTSLVFMAAPKDYQTQQDKELVGRIMSFSLMLGLSLGGCFSFLFIE
jgi:equilibrative nucleoside transporter 1/2/3